MNIGFDAKRAFHNNTGLGNYSRTLITGLANFYPEHKYLLFNPKQSDDLFDPSQPNISEVLPEHFFSKKLSSLWRSKWVVKDLERLNVEIYHGLSHEIPFGIHKTRTRSVVTIHDLIFERYPNQYKKIDVEIYRKKFKYACANADRVIAISEQTKNDLIELYKVDENKIDVCYQSCDQAFAKQAPHETREKLRKALGLPRHFFLYVGSIIERKNLLSVCKALKGLNGQINIPLVVIGNGKRYKEVVIQYLHKINLAQQVIFLSDTEAFSRSMQTPKSMAGIYQMATALIYPSFYEGFGIPVLEALWSRLPVITSNVSCLPETGGDAALYVNPASIEEIATAMESIYQDEALRNSATEKGWRHAQNFSIQKCTESVMNVYKSLM